MANLIDKLLKNSTTKNASILFDSTMFKDKDIISTEIPILNVALAALEPKPLPGFIFLLMVTSKPMF